MNTNTAFTWQPSPAVAVYRDCLVSLSHRCEAQAAICHVRCNVLDSDSDLKSLAPNELHCAEECDRCGSGAVDIQPL
jgi:hypothetical protein